jgi:ectoine hydroxylase-related dioxygenase (phytanoyl-CoA dioxygenase family)
MTRKFSQVLMYVAELKHFDSATSCDLIAEELLRNGAVIVEGVLSPDLLARFNKEIDPYLDNYRPDREWIADVYKELGDNKRNVMGLAGKSEVFLHEMLCHPTYMKLCDIVLKPHCSSYQLNYTHVFDVGPGARVQALHRDGLCWARINHSGMNIELASIIALNEFTVDNGATLVVPGSHLWDPDRKPDPGEAVPAVMPAGSAVFYLNATYHSAGANTTARVWRRGMHLSYIVGWLRTEENNYLLAPLERVRGLSKHELSILGYGAHEDAAKGGGPTGLYDMLDPAELISQGKL